MPAGTSKSNAIALGCLIVLLGGWAAYPDCGSIPYSAPVDVLKSMTFTRGPRGDSNVEFDPLEVVVFEPGQRAIILWNGLEEILLLSTEIRTSEPVSILEVIPLPDKPSVRLGDFETFRAMQRLLIDKTMWRVAAGGGIAGVKPPASAAEIVFHEKMGAHDLSVLHVLDGGGFLSWVNEFLAGKQAVNPKVDPDFAKIIERYIGRGVVWFAFDGIEAADRVRSRQPIEYRFKTDHLYYPLEISSRETGKTNIDLLVVTPKILETVSDVGYAVKREKGVTLRAADIDRAVEDWAGFMGSGSCAMQRLRIRGDIRRMTADLVAR